MGLNVVFLGTPEFAVASLDAIRRSKHHVSAVITNPDKPAGRGQKVLESPVKQYCMENEVAVLQPESLTDINFIQDMKHLDADIYVVVAFKILPKEFYSIPKYGTFNLHASLLPKLRGASPINFAIINGFEETGVTTFYIDEKVDTGNILAQEKLKIDDRETAGSLHDKLMEIGANLVVETLNGIEDFSLHTKSQDNLEKSYAPKLDKYFCEIYWSEPLEYLDRKIRGLSPKPGAYITFIQDQDEKTLKIYNGNYEKCKVKEEPGTVIIEDGKMKIAHKEGYYLPSELQLEGKRKMDVKDFVNGLKNNHHLKVKTS